MFSRRESAPAGEMKLIVGLGNIGREYEHTRHNIGFEVIDEVARRANAHFRKGKFKGEDVTVHIGGTRVLLLKPHTLMNLSGEAVVAAARFYKIAATSILVICDDIYLPLGKLRLRGKGGDGGHNGLWSIIHRLGSDTFARLRVGVGGAPAEMELANYVLSRFLAQEVPAIHEARDRAASAAESWVRDGIEGAMNRFNADK
jgi:PTH1 family peptidyl-tRNA hydrolase